MKFPPFVYHYCNVFANYVRQAWAHIYKPHVPQLQATGPIDEYIPPKRLVVRVPPFVLNLGVFRGLVASVSGMMQLPTTGFKTLAYNSQLDNAGFYDLLLGGQVEESLRNAIARNYKNFLDIIDVIRKPKNAKEANDRLEELESKFLEIKSPWAIFLLIYRKIITLNVVDVVAGTFKIDGKIFELYNRDFINRLSGEFAHLYEVAFKGFLTAPRELKLSKYAWYRTFEIGLDKKIMPLVHGILGIISHIMLDLPVGISKTIVDIEWEKYEKAYDADRDLKDEKRFIIGKGGEECGQRYKEALLALQEEKGAKLTRAQVAQVLYANEEYLKINYENDHNKIDQLIEYLTPVVLDTCAAMGDVIAGIISKINRITRRKDEKVSSMLAIGLDHVKRARANAFSNTRKLIKVECIEDAAAQAIARKVVMEEINQEAARVVDNFLLHGLEIPIKRSSSPLVNDIAESAIRSVLHVYENEEIIPKGEKTVAFIFTS